MPTHPDGKRQVPASATIRLLPSTILTEQPLIESMLFIGKTELTTITMTEDTFFFLT